MEQVAWTAIGLLSTALLAMFGMFFYLGSKIDALGSRLDARLDALGMRIDGLASQFASHIIERHSS